MSNRARAAFRGDGARVAEVRAFVESFGAAAGLAHEATQRVVLVLEELCANSTAHGYGPGAPGPIWITLALAPGSVEVVYEDAAAPFNPFARASERTAGDPGGLGIALVRGLSTAARYARRGSRNRIRLDVPVGPRIGPRQPAG
jgi:anti-sigma regulatory factor (Ser/Thr protein kinase)